MGERRSHRRARYRRGGCTRLTGLIPGNESLSRGDEVTCRAKGSPAIVGLVALVVLSSLTITSTIPAGAASKGPLPDRVAYLGSPTFYASSFSVVPGSTVSLHWSGGSTPLIGVGAYFIVTSSVPNFASSTVVTWPAHTSPAPSGRAQAGRPQRRP